MLRCRTVGRSGHDECQPNGKSPRNHRALKSSPVTGWIDHEVIRKERLLLGTQDLREPVDMRRHDVLAGRALNDQHVIDHPAVLFGAVRTRLKVEAAYERILGDVRTVEIERYRRTLSPFEALRAPGLRDLRCNHCRTACAVEPDPRPLDHFLRAWIVTERGVTHEGN